MDELVRRLREFSGALSGEAERSWPDTASTLNGRALDAWQAADALTTLTAALAEVTEVLELRCRRGETVADGGFDGGRITRSLQAARAALREVGRG